MSQALRILHLEDDRHDAELVRTLLAADHLSCDLVVAESRDEFVAALEQERFDLIISDFSLPSYDGRSALLLARAKYPDVPYIFFSGTIGEDAAVTALQDGATDYVLKQRPSRLLAAVRRALNESRERTERKRAEETLRQVQERFQGIYNSSKDAIGYSTLDGLLLDVNQAFTKLTGYSKEDLLTKTYQSLTPLEYRRVEADIINTVIRTGEPAEYEKEYIRKDGTRVPIAITVFIVKGSDGKPNGLATIIKDITERKRAEEHLRQTEAQLRQAQKLEGIGQLAGGIAHDFNNLLTVINGYSELMLKTLPTAHPIRPHAEQIKEAGRRAAALTQQILAFSRRQQLAPVVFNLNDAVTAIETLLRRLLGEHIAIITSPDPMLGRVKADQGQVEQVLMNLAVNARDAMPSGGTLTIETRNVELDESFAQTHPSIQPGAYVKLAVRDTGCGMDTETQTHIFEPFFTTKEPGLGTGLGLATVYGIVTQSGGAVAVESAVGQGSTFSVYLPRVQDEAEPLAQARAGLDAPGGSETILLVEDEDMVRSLARQILRGLGYTILDARQGAKAQEICEKYSRPIHLLLTDLVMPGMNGRELAERLLAVRPEMKALYMSGYVGNTLSQQGTLPAGATLIRKPFTPDVLARKIREVLDETGAP